MLQKGLVVCQRLLLLLVVVVFPAGHTFLQGRSLQHAPR